MLIDAVLKLTRFQRDFDDELSRMGLTNKTEAVSADTTMTISDRPEVMEEEIISRYFSDSVICARVLKTSISVLKTSSASQLTAKGCG